MAIHTVRRTEEDVQREIQRLRERITQASGSARASARSAISYLNQVIRDRREELATLRHRRYQ